MILRILSFLLRICDPKLAYNVKFKKSVAKDLKKVGKPEADRILTKIAAGLPEIADSLPRLKGKFAGLKKYRIGIYRIVFAIVNNTIVITRIRHRKEVYRN